MPKERKKKRKSRGSSDIDSAIRLMNLIRMNENEASRSTRNRVFASLRKRLLKIRFLN